MHDMPSMVNSAMFQYAVRTADDFSNFKMLYINLHFEWSKKWQLKFDTINCYWLHPCSRPNEFSKIKYSIDGTVITSCSVLGDWNTY